MVLTASKSRLIKQTSYSCLILLLAVILYFILPEAANPAQLSWPYITLAMICFIVVWEMGVPMPYVGMVSMERVIQLFLLLTIDFHQAALINALAAMAWPLFNRRYSHNSLSLSLIKSIHNGGMVAIMILTGGWVLDELRVSLPLFELTPLVMYHITVAALVIQFLNFSILGLFYYVDGKKVLELFKPVNLVIELIFVPLGVLTAVLYNTKETELFVTLTAFTVIILYTFYKNVLGRPEKVSINQIIKKGYDHNNFKSVISDMAENVKSLMEFDSLYIAMVNDAESEVDVVYQLHKTQKYPLRPLFDEIQNVVSEQKFVSLSFHNKELDCDTSVMIAPLVNHESAYGILCIQTYQISAYLQSDESLFSEIADKYSMIVSYARAYEILKYRSRDLEQQVVIRTKELRKASNEKQLLLDELTQKSQTLQRLSELDPLTGLYNRRYFNQYIETLGTTQGLAVAMLDIDWFKSINDKYGHTAGDQVLVKISEIMKSQLPQSSIICRYGGEEFLILFQDKADLEAMDICENLRRTIELTDWSFIDKEIKITASLGLHSKHQSSSINRMLDEADKNLYKAKQSGRNQVVSD